MAQEIEAKVLDIDIADVERKLTALGAQKVGEQFFKSTTFDYPGFPLDKDSSWVRMRDDGKAVAIAYKKRLGVSGEKAAMNDSGMEEVEVTVGDFALMTQLLLKIGMIEKFVQEKKRRTWQLGDVTFDIDEWPRLNPYIEIEAPTWEQVDQAIVGLGFSLGQKVVCSATQIYERAGIRDKDYVKMTFDEFIRRDA